MYDKGLTDTNIDRAVLFILLLELRVAYKI